MTEATVAPALTAEEWADAIEDEPDTVLCMYSEAGSNCLEGVDFIDHRPHVIAALALHGQPFGFTRGDVELVRDCIGMEWDRGERGEMDALEKRLESLAARIAALLPPEAS